MWREDLMAFATFAGIGGDSARDGAAFEKSVQFSGPSQVQVWQCIRASYQTAITSIQFSL